MRTRIRAMMIVMTVVVQVVAVKMMLMVVVMVVMLLLLLKVIVVLMLMPLKMMPLVRARTDGDGVITTQTAMMALMSERGTMMLTRVRWRTVRSDKMFPSYGFGGKLPNGQVSHCFALNSTPENPKVASQLSVETSEERGGKRREGRAEGGMKGCRDKG